MLPAATGSRSSRSWPATRQTGDVPVVLLTAKTQLEDRRAGWRAGCTEYLTKPFSPVDLVEMPSERRGDVDGRALDRRERELAPLDS